LIKLFEINIVANNFAGLLKSSATNFIFPFLVFSSDRSVLDKEKKATSEPDMIAEEKSSATSVNMLKTTGQSIFDKKRKIRGSGSKFN
jgi:hypothetical protein